MLEVLEILTDAMHAFEEARGETHERLVELLLLIAAAADSAALHCICSFSLFLTTQNVLCSVCSEARLAWLFITIIITLFTPGSRCDITLTL